MYSLKDVLVAKGNGKLLLMVAIAILFVSLNYVFDSSVSFDG